MNAFNGKKAMLAMGLCMALNQVQAKEVAFTCQAEQPYEVVAFKQRGTGEVLVSRRNGSDEKVVASSKGRLTEVVTCLSSNGVTVRVSLPAALPIVTRTARSRCRNLQRRKEGGCWNRE